MMMMVQRSLARAFYSVTILVAVIPSLVAEDRKAFRAILSEFPGSNSGVTGFAYVFKSGEDSVTDAVLGQSFGSAEFCESGSCEAVITTGFACSDAATDNALYLEVVATGHFDLPTSHWSKFYHYHQSSLPDLEGRAFLYSSPRGEKIACGLLEELAADEILEAAMEPIAGATPDNVIGNVQVVPKDEESACFFGLAKNLNRDSTCDESAGSCGSHIHTGFSCTSRGGHLYDQSISPNPWSFVGYDYVDFDGDAMIGDCVEFGAFDLKGRAFVVHADSGASVSCGILDYPALLC